MKFKLLVAFLLFTNYLVSQNFHDTQGKLEISNSGQAIYTIPIATPPSINNVSPKISLTYTSGQFGGVAGQGWNINTISSINRMSTRKDIDGFNDGVDFDENDKLAFDGQRLIIKSGDYWADGSIYMTEVQSNTKIELKGTGTSMHFIVTAPDGSRSWYGNYGGSNAVDLTAFYIVRFEDTNGNYITYDYFRPNNKGLYIKEIKFTGNSKTTIAPINSLIFDYKQATRIENAYLKTLKIEKESILQNIIVKTNNLTYKKYELFHTLDSNLGYEYLTKVQESNGAGELANPIEFTYNSTQMISNNSEKQISYNNNLNFSEIQFSGDFDGDGTIDFITNNSVYTKLFESSGPAAPIPLTNEIINTPKKFKFIATTLDNSNKLQQKQSIVIANLNGTNGLTFKIFNIENNTLVFKYSKNALFNNGSTDINYTNILEGDFNGDGLSEVLIAAPNIVEPDNDPLSWCNLIGLQPCQIVKESNYFVFDLNPNTPSIPGNEGLIRVPQGYLVNFPINNGYNVEGKNEGKHFADFNGDGKTDYLQFDVQYDIYTGKPVSTKNGNFTVSTLKTLPNSPWFESETIGTGSIPAYTSLEKTILFGDYNGDGKTDIMIPEGDGKSDNQTNWGVYYSNPKGTNLGTSMFEKEIHTIVEYRPIKQADTWTSFNSYYALDTNNDGKSDLVWIHRNKYKPSMTINDHNTKWKVTSYVNKTGITNITNKFPLDYTSPCYTVSFLTDCEHNNDSPDLPIPIVSNYRFAGLDKDLVMVRNHHNQLTYVDFSKDAVKDSQLQTIKSANGEIVEKIEYSTMEPKNSGTNSLGNLTDFYSSTNSLNYPYLEVIKLPKSYLVSKIYKTVAGVTKFQNFKYHGFTINLNGLGVVGFKKFAKSDWQLSNSNKIIWTVIESDPLLRGSNIKTYTQLLDSTTPFTFLNSGTPSGLINSYTNTFSNYTINNQYYLILNNKKTTDHITGVSTEESFNYDPNYVLPLSTTTINKLNGVAQGTTTVENTFANNPSGLDSDYYIGRLLETKTTTNAYGDTFSTSTQYTYNNNLISKVKKRGNTTENKFLVEQMEYDLLGNIIKKTTSTEGFTSLLLSPKSIEYTYDSTGRFLKTIKDSEGLISINNSFHPLYGNVLSSSNPFGLTTTSEIDNWGKTTKVTDFLGKSVNYTYTRTINQITLTQTGDDGSSSSSTMDVQGRVIKIGSKNIDGSWSYRNTEYDSLGRKYRVSEPYLSTSSPTLWNITTYDDYNRIIKIDKSTGLTTYISYNGLTVSANEGSKTTSSTKNANGHMISSTDNGGTINFTYYANGNQKTSNYEGTVITTEYDEWGNKTKLSDPSAGTYTYAYYPTGELYKETTPKGETIYTLDPDSGKLIEKWVKGLTATDATDLKTTYIYDSATKLLNSSTLVDGISGITTTYKNTYDTNKRLIATVEENNLIKFENNTNYDSFGRADTITYKSTSKETNKLSIVTTKNTYKNGGHWQILDNATARVLWETKTVDARGNLATASLGNGINITNTFDQYGFPTQFKHELGMTAPVNIMTLNTTFEPKQGNLITKYSSLFNIAENFEYDALDRLISWSNPPKEINRYVFNSGVEGFSIYGASTTITNYSGKLQSRVLAYSSGVEKEILVNAIVGQTINISGEFTKTYGTTPVFAWIVETDPISLETIETQVTGMPSGTFNFQYTIQNYSNIKLRFGTDIGFVEDFKISNKITNRIPIDGTLPNVTFRLDNIIISNTTPENVITQEYDNKGRIKKSNLGIYNYTNTAKQYQNTSVTLSPDGQSHYVKHQLQTISYNAFKSPINITVDGIDKIDFNYNINNSRSAMYYGGLNDNKLQRRYRRYYAANGAAEITFDTQFNTVDIATYVGGDAYSAPILTKSNGTTQNYLYLHRDYQGTILAITNDSGAIVEKRHFDAWGEITKIQDGAGNNLARLTVTDRGYTGHEHLQSVGLIHMNGRLYDPKLHRFLQPDNFIQDPYNTQCYNRYGYVFNNPLKYTDPSGEIAPLLAVGIGAFIAATTYTLTALLADVPFTLGGFVKATFVGALTSYITFGVADGLATACKFASTAVGFWSGAAQGAITGAVTGVTGTFAGTILGGGTLTLKQLITSGLVSAGFGGVIGGLQAGANAKKIGFDYWSGKGEVVTSMELPATSSTAVTNEQYQSTAEVRNDYNTTIAPIDNITLEQAEKLANTDVFLASKSNLAPGYSLSNDGFLTDPNGNLAGGYNYARNDGGVFSKPYSQCAISPAVKGFDIDIKNMIFKHELMHAWHWSKLGIINFAKYSERATSAYSLAYVKARGADWLANTYRSTISAEGGLYYPRQYSWRNFNKILPLWIK